MQSLVMRFPWFLSMLAAISAWLPAELIAQPLAEARVALVIGNAAYAESPLLNTIHDAKAMSDTLRRLGFTVIESHDADKSRLEQAIAQAQEALRGRNGIGLFYYAGHGLQLGWRNYIVPVDAKLSSADQVPARTVDVQRIIEAFHSAGNRLNIVVLDACRNNPFGSLSTAQGLAPVDAPPGTLLAFATAPGNLAEDGDVKGGQGLYTQYLVEEMKRPGARIEDVFKRVRLQVRQRSDSRQVPWESTSLEEDFSFDPAFKSMKTGPADPDQLEREFVKEKADWDRIKESKVAGDFYAFLQKYPNGLISEQAQFKLDRVQQASARPQPGPSGIRTFPSGTNRYVTGDEWVVERTDHVAGTTRRITLRVTHATNDRVEVNAGAAVYDQMGGVVRDRFGVKEPALMVAPADLAIGKRWRAAFTNTKPDGQVLLNYWEYHVAALEEIQVPAGSFKAFRIEGRGGSREGKRFSMQKTLWIDPATMLQVRIDLVFRRGDGTVYENTSDVLVRRSRVPRPGE